MTGLTLPRTGRTALRGRHIDPPRSGTWLLARLNPVVFVQTMLVVCLLLAIWPTTLGGRFGMVMVAGSSMEPTYMLGDAVVTWRQPVAVGDTILFRVPEGDQGEGNPIIHRVIDGNGSGWITQGDNMTLPDEWSPTDGDVLGVARFHVPLGGRALGLMRSWLFIGLMGGIAAGLLLWPEPKDENGEQDEQDEPAPSKREKAGRCKPRGRHLA